MTDRGTKAHISLPLNRSFFTSVSQSLISCRIKQLLNLVCTLSSGLLSMFLCISHLISHFRPAELMSPKMLLTCYSLASFSIVRLICLHINEWILAWIWITKKEATWQWSGQSIGEIEYFKFKMPEGSTNSLHGEHIPVSQETTNLTYACKRKIQGLYEVHLQCEFLITSFPRKV